MGHYMLLCESAHVHMWVDSSAGLTVFVTSRLNTISSGVDSGLITEPCIFHATHTHTQLNLAAEEKHMQSVCLYCITVKHD